MNPAAPSGGADRASRRVSARFSDLSLAAQIRATALRLFAELGVGGTSMRTIAAEVGVSLGAVVHHFPSKHDLEVAVQRDVTEQILDAVHGAGVGLDVVEQLRARRQAWLELLTRSPEIGAYLSRILTARNEGSVELAKVLVEGIRAEHAELLEQGVVRRLDDPEAGMVLYFSIVHASVFLQPFLTSVFGMTGSDTEVLERLQRCELDLLTRPLFLTGPDAPAVRKGSRRTAP